jgi:hypothetical protein
MPSDVDALNYPYIRVRSVDWLKRTLLVFPHVVRMTPASHAPADDPEVGEYCWTGGSRGPLLRPAKLWEPHVQEAQADLIRQLDKLRQARGSRFMDRFRQENTRGLGGGATGQALTVWERRLSGQFQIHRYKILDDLATYLLNESLAWEPAASYSDGPDYLEMNPRLGEAVMATLAVACAENEGLRVVTEFPRLHGQLIGTPRDAILGACLEDSRASGETSGQQIAEFLVYRRCDVSSLTAERIAALKRERDALADFREELEKLAGTLPPMIYSDASLQERLNDQINDIFVKWQRDQANLSSFARKIFGEGVLDEPDKLAQELAKSVANPEGAAAVAASASVAGAHLGGLTLNIAAGAAAGFVVAIVFRLIRVWGETKTAERESPFRYLTALQKHGVTFSFAPSNS